MIPINRKTIQMFADYAYSDDDSSSSEMGFKLYNQSSYTIYLISTAQVPYSIVTTIYPKETIEFSDYTDYSIKSLFACLEENTIKISMFNGTENTISESNTEDLGITGGMLYSYYAIPDLSITTIKSNLDIEYWYAYVINNSTTYTITTTLTNLTSSGDTSIEEDGTATVTLTADSEYTLPTEITVSGATYTYDSSTGVISLSSPTGDITITASGVEDATYNLKFNDNIVKAITYNGEEVTEVIYNGNTVFKK